jgi:hypothetical protein
VLRRALQIDGIFAWYFVLSAATHAGVGEDRTAFQSLLQAFWISPLHVGAAVVRKPGMFGWVAPSLLRLPSARSLKASA